MVAVAKFPDGSGSLTPAQKLEAVRYHLDRWEKAQKYDCDPELKELQGKSLIALLEEEVGLKRRSAYRYMAILKTPEPVQEAFKAGRLGIEEAASASNLRGPKYNQLQTELAEGGDAAAIVKKLVKPDWKVNRKVLQRQFQNLLLTLKRTAHLSGNLWQIKKLGNDEVEELQAAVEFFTGLHGEAQATLKDRQAKKEEGQKRLQKMVEQFKGLRKQRQ